MACCVSQCWFAVAEAQDRSGFDERDSYGNLVPDLGGSSPGDPGWYGPDWETDPTTGALTPSVSVTSFPGEADQWLYVSVYGVGVEYGWCMGPYATLESTFSVPIELPIDANGPGLVQVHVLMEVTDHTTGDLRALEQTRPAYVSDAGLEGEAWYDEVEVEARVVRNLQIAIPENVVVEGLLGLEVSP